MEDFPDEPTIQVSPSIGHGDFRETLLEPALPPPAPEHKTWTFTRHLLVVLAAFILGGLVATGVCAAVLYRKKTQQHARKGGVVPIHPSFCISFDPNQQPFVVPVKVDGQTFLVIPDTGSSNLGIAASPCTSCHVSPRLSGDNLPGPRSREAFQISYGTGSTVNVVGTADLEIAPGLTIKNGKLGATVHQNTSFGFNLFPTREGAHVPATPTPTHDTCYNTFSGVMGLAYQSQGAQPDPHAKTGPTLTNGTATHVVDQAVRQLGVPNAFAIEICQHYPYNCAPQRRSDNRTWDHLSTCAATPVGHVFWGGYSSARTSGDMVFAALTDQIHFDVQLRGMRVCGLLGCKDIVFPDTIDGETEDDCYCSTPDCADGTVDYCYFAVVESGASRIYMNTPANAAALLDAMADVHVVRLPAAIQSNRTAIKQFYWDKTPVKGAALAPNASLVVVLRGAEGSGGGSAHAGYATDVHVPVALDGPIFRPNVVVDGVDVGMIQWGIQGDMKVLNAYSHAKFPTLLGSPFFQGKTIFFDRSRKRVGFAPNAPGQCSAAATAGDIDRWGANALPTPGAGCRRGTGSGGGCKGGDGGA